MIHFKILGLTALLLIGSASASYGQKEVLSSFCKFPLTDGQMQANFTFTQGYRIKIDKEGRVAKVDRILGKEEWVSIDKAKACFANWKFTGFDDGRAFVVFFSWKHGIGWTGMTISGGDFSQRVLSGDSEPCPTDK